MDDPFTIMFHLASRYGIDPITMLAILGLVVALSNVIGRLIPDDAVGTLGFIRKVAKAIGLYVSNRVSSGVSVNQVAKAAIGVEQEHPVVDLMKESGALPPDNGVILGRNDKGQFTNLKSHWIVGLIALMVMCALVSACSTVGIGLEATGKALCLRHDQVQLGLIVARTKAESIVDPVKREAAIGAINTTQAALDSCPNQGNF